MRVPKSSEYIFQPLSEILGWRKSMHMSLYPVSPVANRATLSNFKGRAKMLAVWMISMLEVHAGDVRRIQMTIFF